MFLSTSLQAHKLTLNTSLVMELQYALQVNKFSASFDVYTADTCRPTTVSYENRWLSLSGPTHSAGTVTLPGTLNEDVQ